MGNAHLRKQKEEEVHYNALHRRSAPAADLGGAGHSAYGGAVAQQQQQFVLARSAARSDSGSLDNANDTPAYGSRCVMGNAHR